MSMSSELYDKLYYTLSKMETFQSNRELNSVFVDSRIALWRDGVPQPDTISGRIRQTLMFLSEQNNNAQENALVLFLRVLSEQASRKDSLHCALTDLAQEVESELKYTVEYDQKEIGWFRDTLLNNSSFEEIRKLAFEYCDVNHEEFSGNVRDFVEELISYSKFRRTLDLLAQSVLKEWRELGDDNIVATLARLWIKWGGEISKQVKVVIIVATDLRSRVLEFVDELAKRLEVEPSKIHVLKIASGSTHLLISLPRPGASLLVESSVLQINDVYTISSAKSFDALDINYKKAWYLAPTYEPSQKESSDLSLPTPWEELVNQVETSVPDARSGAIQRREDMALSSMQKSNRPKSIRCKLGLHNWIWDRWAWDKESCERKAHCTRCPAEKTRYQHEWTRWDFYDEKSCVCSRTCLRCGKKEYETIKRHNWGTYFPDGKNHCKVTRVCQRCGEVEVQENNRKHDWSAWLYLSDGNCAAERVCKRCEHTEHKILHRFERQEYTSKTGVNCKTMYICVRCDEKIAGPDVHKWRSPEFESERSCKLVQRCQICQAQQHYGEVPHDWKDWVVDKATGKLRRACRRCGIEEYKVRTSSA